MTSHASAQKRVRQSEKTRLRNKSFKSAVSTAIKQCRSASNEDAKTQDSLGLVYSMMDKGVKKGVFHKNKANRIKSRLASQAAAK